MAATLTDLKAHIGETSIENDELLNGCLLEAQALVARYNVKWDEATAAWVASDAPAVIVTRAEIEVAADLWYRRSAPNGIVTQQFATADGVAATPMRIARDPMAAAYKVLGRWVTPW